jgi:hypothetical protein
MVLQKSSTQSETFRHCLGRRLCFERVAVAQGERTTPAETLALGFFSQDDLPEPFVPIHGIRVADAASGDASTPVR